MKQQISEKQLINTAKQYETALARKKGSANRLAKIMTEVKETVESLKEMQKVDGKVFMKLGAGVFVEVEAKNLKTCKRGLTENSFIEDKIPDTIKWLEKKEKALEKNLIAEKKDIMKLERGLSEMLSLIRQIEAEKQKNFSRK